MPQTGDALVTRADRYLFPIRAGAPLWNVANSTFTRNQARGGSSAGGGIYSYGLANARNCTFAGNLTDYEGGGFCGYYYTIYLDNCILWGNSAPSGPQVKMQSDDPSSDSGDLIVSYSDVQGGLWGVTDGGSNIVDDPQFISPPTTNSPGNVHLLSSSPCINAGNNTVVPSEDSDLDGNARILNSAVDMGAYEFVPDTTPPTITFGTPTPAPNAAGWNNTPVSIPYTVTDDGSGVPLSLSSGTFNFGSEGDNQRQSVTVTDNAGNSATASPPKAVNIDWTAPATTGSVSGNTITLTATDNLSGVNATYYAIGIGGTPQVYTAPFTLPPGVYDVFYVSVDNADNPEEVHYETYDLRIAVSLVAANVSGRRGGKVRLSATLTQTSNGAKLSDKAITFYVDGASVGVANTDRFGKANLSYTIPTGFTVGSSHRIGATFVSDETYQNADAPATLTVTR